TDAPVDEDVRQRILDAGRLSGSSKNRQRWEFVVVSGEARERLAEVVHAPENVQTAALVVAVVGEASGFDAGRCVQNMMLAAWGDRVVSCPNGVRDADAAGAICGSAAGAPALWGGGWGAVSSSVSPPRPRAPGTRSAEGWSAGATRKPLSEL